MPATSAQPVKLRDGLRLAVGDGLGIVPGPGEDVGRLRLRGIQVGRGSRARAFEVRVTECPRHGRLVPRGAARGVRGVAQRLGELVTSGAGPVRGLTRLAAVFLDLACLPVPVGFPILRRLLLAAGVLAELLEPFGVAHGGIGPQRLSARLQPGALFLQLRKLVLRRVQLPLCGREGLFRGAERRLCLDQSLAQVDGVQRAEHPLPAPPSVRASAGR